MESITMYHRTDPSCGQEQSKDANNNLGVLGAPSRKAGVKRKLSDPDQSYLAKRVATENRGKKPTYIDYVLSLKKELAWMKQLESRACMRLEDWPEGDLVWEGCNVTKEKRTEMVNWIILLHQGFKLEKNTLCVAVNLLDRFIQKGRVSMKAIRPIALSCLWIASKVSDQYHMIPREEVLMTMLGPDHTLDEFHTCERMVLRAVNCNLWRPTILQFAEKYASVLKPELVASVRDKMLSAVELCLRDVNMSYRNPSEVGLSVLSYALGLESDNVADQLLDVSEYEVHSQHGLVVHICNAAYLAYEAEEDDPIFNKYPEAFAPKSNLYLCFRILASDKDFIKELSQ